MKRTLFSFLALILLLSTLLTACGGPSIAITEEKTEETAEETVLTTSESVKETVEEIKQRDPGPDRMLNVLVIGNSFSTGWPDELNGLLTAAGVKANVFSVYYSGCPLVSHNYWLKTGQKFYRLRHHKQAGGIDDYNDVNLKFCLKQRNWDVISLQQHFAPKNALSYDDMWKTCDPHAEELLTYLKTNFPKSKIVWHQTWAYEVGWERDGIKIEDVAFQTTYHENIRACSQKIATENNVPIVPCGEAWNIARSEYNTGDLSRDGYHDGPENGGQYLNACVWLESLTGISPVGNTWRPKYEIAEERILMLQEIAHKAVEQNTFK